MNHRNPLLKGLQENTIGQPAGRIERFLKKRQKRRRSIGGRGWKKKVVHLHSFSTNYKQKKKQIVHDKNHRVNPHHRKMTKNTNDKALSKKKINETIKDNDLN